MKLEHGKEKVESTTSSGNITMIIIIVMVWMIGWKEYMTICYCIKDVIKISFLLASSIQILDPHEVFPAWNA